MDTLFNSANLGRKDGILPSKYVKAEARNDQNAVILAVGQDRDQLGCAVATLGQDDSELRHMRTDGIGQHRSLANEELPAAMQHQY